MARYIDADKFIERLEVSPAFPNMGMDGFFLRDVVINMLGNMPTADVVPKSEVIAIFHDFEELIDLVGVMVGLDIRVYGSYRELKKKYTEEKKGED